MTTSASDVMIELRLAQETDMDFLLRLRETTMGRYLAEAGAPTDRETHIQRIRAHFEEARIVLVNGQRAGLFKYFFIPEKSQWFVGQIQLHPDCQGLGIGQRLIKGLIEQANAEGHGVGLSVLKVNPALRLYQRLGFREVGENALEFLMEYRG